MKVLDSIRKFISKTHPRNDQEDGAIYRKMEIYLYDTCVLKCGYCTLAETGAVLDNAQLQPFKEKSYITRITDFFNSRTTQSERWLLILAGGDPLLMPNLDLFCDQLFAKGNRVAFYTSLAFGKHHRWFQYLLSQKAPDVDYIMASFHPECEAEEADYLKRVKLLKEAGHHVFLRYVGHPKRLNRLGELAAKCKAINVCFYPTTLFSPNYPQCYTAEEKDLLRSFFVSYSQAVQLNGGVDTSQTRCHAGNRILAVNLKNGLITPCISVDKPILGNIFENQLNLLRKPIRCPLAGEPCSCDVHFQQDIVIGAEDGSQFEAAKRRYLQPLPLSEQDRLSRQKGLPFSRKTGVKSIGQVVSIERLFYEKDIVKAAYARQKTGFAAPIEAPS